MLWTNHLGLVQNLAGLIAESRDVRALVEETDGDKVRAVLANEFGRDLLTRGDVRMLGLAIYSPDLRKIGEFAGATGRRKPRRASLPPPCSMPSATVRPATGCAR